MIDYDVDDEKQSTDNSKGSYVSVKFGTLTVTVDEGKLEFIGSNWTRARFREPNYNPILSFPKTECNK